MKFFYNVCGTVMNLEVSYFGTVLITFEVLQMKKQKSMFKTHGKKQFILLTLDPAIYNLK